MAQRLINFLFAVAITLAAGLFFLGVTKALADTRTAMSLLRETTARVEGLGCSGSGSIVEGKSGKHYLLTNSHVCNCARYKGGLYASFDNGEMLHGNVVKQDWGSDLCAALLPSDAHSVLKVANRLPKIAEVNTRGYPAGRLSESHGYTKEDTDWDVLFPLEEVGECPAGSIKGYGLNSNLAACQLHYTSTLTSLYGRPGSSGSPVVDDDGFLVGVISSFHPGEDYDAGMVPFRQVKRFMESL